MGTRAEKWKQLRLEKKKTLAPPEQELAEGFLKRFDQKGNHSVEDTNFWGFHPRVEWIARGSGAALGARYWKPNVFGPVDMMGAAFYSWRRYQHYDFQFGLIPHRGKKIPPRSFEREDVEQLGDVDTEAFSRFKLYVSGRYRDRTDDSFFGRGIDSKREDRVYYRIKDTSVEAVTGYQFGRRVGWTVKAGLIQNSLAPGRSEPTLDPLPPGSAVPGFFTPPNYFRLATSFLFDYRDDPGVPHKGFMVAFGWDRLDNVNTFDRFNFHRFAVDLRAYIPLGSVQRVIALRAFLVDSDPSEGNRVPFFFQPSLGGGESLRAYEAFRFQGDKLLLVQAEYRWEASRRVEFALFGDTGSVANKGQRISLDKLKSDWGIGLRFKTSRATIFRMDQAWGNEGGRLQFRFSAVF